MKKSLDHYLRKPGDAVGIVPLIHFETQSRLSERKSLFEEFPGSIILHLGGFSELLKCKHQSRIWGTLGTLEGNFIDKSHVVMVPLKAVSTDSALAMDTLNDLNALIKNFISNLWHYRDNSVNSDAGYLFVSADGQPLVHKNDMKLHFYDAHGLDTETTTFNYKEIFSAAAMASKSAQRYMADAKLAHQKPTKRVKGESRVDCFITWVIDARRQEDILTRIATYVTALEALLSTSNAELSHQLSERVALLNPVSGEVSPRAAFTEMKKAYNLPVKGFAWCHGPRKRSE